MSFDNITETIGRTPVVRIHTLAPAHVELEGIFTGITGGATFAGALQI